jgi:trans-2,3-dihydro-3-hydroxyanthranilate isomerase
MPTYAYHLLDVFTDQPFGGNQLAVFPDAAGMPGDVMQRLARELNLAETTFVLPPRIPDCEFHVRIFTPAVEMPMAGHPTVGTADVLYRLGRFSGDRVHFEEGVVVIPVEITGEATRPLIWMDQPEPTFGPRFEDRALLAEMLCLDEADLDPTLPAEAGSAGVPFLLTPLKTRTALDRIRLRLDLWEQHLAGYAAPHVFAFAPEPSQPNTVHSRMFGPALGIPEDPATGAASGPLGSYLVRHSQAAVEDGVATIVSLQGEVMGRPSRVHIQVTPKGGGFARVRVGGTCQPMGEGSFKL